MQALTDEIKKLQYEWYEYNQKKINEKFQEINDLLPKRYTNELMSKDIEAIKNDIMFLQNEGYYQLKSKVYIFIRQCEIETNLNYEALTKDVADIK